MRKIGLTLFVALFAIAGCKTTIQQTRLTEDKLVNSNYPAVADKNNLSFAYARPVLSVEADISEELREGLYERLKYQTDNIACHLYGELDKVILSKGFTITDRYRSLKYMTFTEKRNASALFYPEIKIKIKEKSDIDEDSTLEFKTSGTLEIEAEINIIMLEPMSKEIIWIKSIPVDNVVEGFSYDNAFWAGWDGNLLKRNINKFKVTRGTKHTVPENMKHIGTLIDSIYSEIDNKIIEATIAFVDAEEFKFLNSDIKKLKTIKRY